MSDLPTELKYTQSHEWVRNNEDGTFTVGITDHAQELLGDIVFVETPEEEAEIEAGDGCAVVESVKAASDIYMPISGEVASANGELADTPEAINDDPYQAGWIFTLKSSGDEWDNLLTAEQYAGLLEEEED